MKAHGVPYPRTLVLESDANRNEFLDLLKRGHPAYLSFTGAWAEYLFKRYAYQADGTSGEPSAREERFSSLHPDSEAHSSRHAVAAVGLVEVEGYRYMIILDSAHGEVQLWSPALLKEARFGQPMVAVIPSFDPPAMVGALPADALAQLRENHNHLLADWIAAHPDRLRPIPNAVQWIQQHPEPGHWLLYRRHAAYAGGLDFATAFGRSIDAGAGSTGGHYIQYQGYEYGEFRPRKKARIVWDKEIEALYEVTRPSDTRPEAIDPARVMTTAEFGDHLAFAWSPDPATPAVEVQGRCFARDENGLKIWVAPFDSNAGQVISFSASEMVHNVVLTTRQAPFEQIEPDLRAGHLASMTARYSQEGYSSWSIANEGDRVRKNAHDLVTAFPRATESRFEPDALPVDSWIVVLLQSGLSFEDQSVALVQVAAVTENSLRIRVGYNKYFTIKPENVEGILRFTTPPPR